MDVRADLLRAIERARLELRARMGGMRKQKKLKKLGRPAKTGPGAGCGTGSGGFQSGNNCALEDGIPQKPFAKGGALKKANPKQLKAEVQAQKQKTAAKVAAKEAAQKKKGLLIRRKNAAARKQEKEAKAAEEAKKASEAAAAKKKAFVQGVRIKKANEQVKVAGTPKSVKEQLDEAKASMKAKTAEASKQLTVAGTPKSLKQEIEELKASKASAALKVVGTPKSIKQELDELKARLAAEKKVAADKKAAEKEPPKPEVTVGASLQSQKAHLSQAQKDSLEKDKELLFGAHLKDGWGAFGGMKSEKVRSDQKREISLNAAKALDDIGIKESDVDDDILTAIGGKSWQSFMNAEGVPPGLQRRYALSSVMVSSWAGSSGKGPAAIGIQFAIQDTLKVKRAQTRHLKSQLKGQPDWEARAEVIRKHKAVQAVIRAHYEATQADLKRKGIKELVLVRGYKSSAKINPDGEQDVALQPGSSFSTNKSTSEMFAGGGKTQRYLTVKVPADRVLSTCITGFGCMHEQELVVLGGITRGRLVGSSSKW